MKSSKLFVIRNWAFLALFGATASAVVGFSRTADADRGVSEQGRTFDHGPLCDMRKELGVHDAMRKLWEDHVTWTRMFIVSFEGGLADLDQATQRLLQNQVDIGDLFKIYYGEKRGTELTQLLTDHILIAAQILTAAKGGDSAAVNSGVTQWRANATEIAQFWHRINPREWPFEQMQEMMFMHLDLTLNEAVARLSGDYASDVKDYDDVVAHILGMADVLSDGIVRQFRGRFE